MVALIRTTLHPTSLRLEPTLTLYTVPKSTLQHQHDRDDTSKVSNAFRGGACTLHGTCIIMAPHSIQHLAGNHRLPTLCGAACLAPCNAGATRCMRCRVRSAPNEFTKGWSMVRMVPPEPERRRISLYDVRGAPSEPNRRGRKVASNRWGRPLWALRWCVLGIY